MTQLYLSIDAPTPVSRHAPRRKIYERATRGTSERREVVSLHFAARVQRATEPLRRVLGGQRPPNGFVRAAPLRGV